jgi:hypothetical protein
VFERKVMVQGRTLRGLIRVLASERRRNARKAVALKWAYGFLMAGLILVSGAVVTIVLSTFSGA